MEIETKFALAGINLDFKKKAAEEARQRGLRRSEEVLDQIRQTYEQNTKNPEAQMAYAWVLATSPYEELRDGKLALKLAEQASRAFRDKEPEYLVTLAAAQAEDGAFKRAVETVRKASAIYMERGDAVKAASLGSRITLYEKGKIGRASCRERV